MGTVIWGGGCMGEGTILEMLYGCFELYCIGERGLYRIRELDEVWAGR